MLYFFNETSPLDEFIVSTLGTDDLVLKQQGISTHGADDACKHSPVFNQYPNSLIDENAF